MRRVRVADGWSTGDVAAIAVGGIAGATLRWLIARTYHEPSNGGWFLYQPYPKTVVDVFDFPWATLAANSLGCLVLGLLVTLHRRADTDPSQPVGREPAPRPRALLGAGIGFCGSLTTFSTFAVEAAQRLRMGNTLAVQTPTGSETWMIFGPHPAARAALYIGLSVLAGGATFALGRKTGLLVEGRGAR